MRGQRSERQTFYSPMHQIDQFAVGILVRDLVDFLQQTDENGCEFEVEAPDALRERFARRHRGFTLQMQATD